MELDKQLDAMRERTAIVPREEAICHTLEGCKEVFCRREQERLLTCGEFLWSQFQYTRKRWWVLQAGLLLAAGQWVYVLEPDYFRVRSLGVIGCLFVILMIPELWRNRETNALQVEASCLYALRQIYAARITLFGMVDVALLTVFSLVLGHMGFTLAEVLAQFLLPVTVTACICFSLLCGKGHYSETLSLTASLVWTGIWWMILLREEIYVLIAPAVWMTLFAMALMFLALAVRRTVCTVNQYWEEVFA